MSKCLHCTGSKTGKACMPNGGLIPMHDMNNGETVKVGDGKTYQVINCIFPRCV